MLREAGGLAQSIQPCHRGLPEAGDIGADLLPLAEGVRRDKVDQVRRLKKRRQENAQLIKPVAD
jgi:hypothetical protein